VSGEALSRIEDRVRAINPELVIARAIHAPIELRHYDGSQRETTALRECRVFAFCGLGNPDAFFRTVAACAGELAGSLAFDDHHAYTKPCLERIYREAQSQGADLLVTSSKDWSKITPLIDAPPLVPLAHLPVEMRFTEGGDLLTSLIERTLSGSILGS